MAVRYDELVRHKWATLAYDAGAHGSFDLEARMRWVDEKVYAEATKGRVLNISGQQMPMSSGYKGTGKGDVEGPSSLMRFDGLCSFCGKSGHRKVDCFAWKATRKVVSLLFRFGLVYFSACPHAVRFQALVPKVPDSFAAPRKSIKDRLAAPRKSIKDRLAAPRS